MNKLAAIICLFGLIVGINTAAVVDDQFEELKAKFSKVGMVQMEIEISVYSQIFDDVDKAEGEISIADDGRYRAEINDDIYLFDGKCIWEYTPEHNQVTKDCLKEGEMFESTLSFLKNLDKYYQTDIVIAGHQYQLTRIDSARGALPDSMTVFINKDELEKIEYYDVNQDLNRIEFEEIEYFESPKEEIFSPSFPASAEVITLP